MDRKLVIIPTYNEIENISKIIAAVFEQPGDFDVLVIDDGSPDGTAAEVKRLISLSPEKGGFSRQEAEVALLSGRPLAPEKGGFSRQEAEVALLSERPLAPEKGGDPRSGEESLGQQGYLRPTRRLHIIERSGKQGLGTAYLTGFKWALDQGYDYVFEMDADFSHSPDDLPRLYEACAGKGEAVMNGKKVSGGGDMAVGSRYCNGVSVVNWPIGRILISYFASVYVRTVLGFRIYDSTAGFVCYSAKVLRTIDFDRIRMKGYGFQIEMKYTASKLGFKIAEVPVIFINRREGTSKMSGSIFGEAFWGVLALRFRKITGKQ